MKLTSEQENFLKEESKKTTDLNLLTKQCFENDSLDGRSKEGRLVRSFLIDQGINFKTTKRAKKKKVTFT